ncbi:hypothetical protein GGX14DRAFT_589131 [Mycena pura]|uniref:Thioredoxin domain-containing protein n=1 Tax=Mycena pura TaxID=153505 RepID=A0AAD6URP3_9AGAR|nr:hypothetical protein GGX14DRAFT_589131 [Mycena pura]
MPLHVVDPSDYVSLLERPEEYIIFYASVENGKMWCGDCRAVDDVVQKTFAPNGPAAAIVYVGSKPEWKAEDNVFRGEPFKVTDVPTIVKLKEKKELARLVLEEINTKLAAFVNSEVRPAADV